MKRKPWSLIILAIGHFFAPLGDQVLNAFWSNMSMSYYLQVALQFHNIRANWIQWVFPIIAGCAIYICKRWSFFIYILSMLSLFFYSYTNYVERLGSQPGLGYELILIFTVNILFVGYFLVPAVREVYFNPRLRWWEADERFRADLPANFGGASAQQYSGVISNISISGLFLKSEHLPTDKEQIEIGFSYAGQSYKYIGEVISHGNQSAVGFGVKFKHHDGSRKTARQLAAALKSSGRQLPERATTIEDSFTYWIKRLFTTGKGLVPEKNPRIK